MLPELAQGSHTASSQGCALPSHLLSRESSPPLFSRYVFSLYRSCIVVFYADFLVATCFFVVRFLSLPSSIYSVVGLLVALTALSAIVKRLLLDCDHLLPKSIAHGVATLVVASNGKFARVKYNHVQDLQHFLRVSNVRKRLAACAVVKKCYYCIQTNSARKHR